MITGAGRKLTTNLRTAFQAQQSRVFPSNARASSMTAAAAPIYDIVVKGDPETNTLWDCPFCHRVLLTLQTKNVPYGITCVRFDKKPDWLIEASGGKVPVLRKDGLVMPDSDKIVVYLEEQHPDISMKSSVDPSVGSKLFPAFRGYLFCKPEEEEEKRTALVAELAALNAALSQPGVGPLFGGTAMNATDAAVAPKLYHVQVALGHYKQFHIPAEYAAIHKYLTYIKTLPAWQACDYGEELIIKGWANHH